MPRLLSLTFLLLCCLCVSAQKMVKVSGTARYVMSDTETRQEARRNALYQAQTNALEAEFGRTITEDNRMSQSDVNGNTSQSFHSLSRSEVRGEWIETIGEPEYQYDFVDGVDVIICTVHGRAREIKEARIDVIAKTLNRPDVNAETSEFHNEEPFYMYFRSPKNGYMAIYLHDVIADEVFCLLPYPKADESIVEIQHDKPYIFFDRKSDSDYIVDECHMFLSPDNKEEVNVVYVVFSPNIFAKANAQRDEGFPHLSFDAFQSWLTRSQRQDQKMQVINKTVIIKK